MDLFRKLTAATSLPSRTRRRSTRASISTQAPPCTATSAAEVVRPQTSTDSSHAADAASSKSNSLSTGACDELVMRKLSLDMVEHSRSASEATCARSFTGAGLTPAPMHQGDAPCVYSAASRNSKEDEGEGSNVVDGNAVAAKLSVAPLQLHPLQSPSNNQMPCNSPHTSTTAQIQETRDDSCDDDDDDDDDEDGDEDGDDDNGDDDDGDDDDVVGNGASVRTATPSPRPPAPRRSVVSSTSTASVSALRRADVDSLASTRHRSWTNVTTTTTTTTVAVAGTGTANGGDGGGSGEDARDDVAGQARAHAHKAVRALRFKLIRELGAGASGTVYLAQLHSGTLVAVKALRRDRNDADLIDREVAVMSRLPPHPNCVRYYGSRHGKHHHYIVMESVSGGSIAATRKATGPFSECALRRYAREVLSGLVHLHAHGIVHRDIKGGNILLDDEGHAKIGDFGCCKDITQLHMTCHASGTPRWMAPEVCRGEAATLKSDVWSFGCLCLEMVNEMGVPWEAFAPHTPLERVVFEIGHATRPPAIPAHLSPAARDFIGACLQIDPAARASTIVLLDHVFFAMDAADVGGDDEDEDDYYDATGTCALSMATSYGRQLAHLANTTMTTAARGAVLQSGSNSGGSTSNSSGGGTRSDTSTQTARGTALPYTNARTGDGTRLTAAPLSVPGAAVPPPSSSSSGANGAAIALVLHDGTRASHNTVTTAAAASSLLPCEVLQSTNSDCRWLAGAQAQLQEPQLCSHHSVLTGGMSAAAVSTSPPMPSLPNTAQLHTTAALSVVCAAPLCLTDSYAQHA